MNGLQGGLLITQWPFLVVKMAYNSKKNLIFALKFERVLSAWCCPCSAVNVVSSGNVLMHRIILLPLPNDYS